MSKLLALLQLLASSGHLTVANHPWPQRLIRRLITGLCLLVAGSVLFGTLAATGLFWGYQYMLEKGMPTDQALFALAGILVLLLIIVGGTLTYLVNEIKRQIRPLLVQPVPLTTHVTQSIQDVFSSFARGYQQGQSASSR